MHLYQSDFLLREDESQGKIGWAVVNIANLPRPTPRARASCCCARRPMNSATHVQYLVRYIFSTNNIMFSLSNKCIIAPKKFLDTAPVSFRNKNCSDFYFHLCTKRITFLLPAALILTISIEHEN